MDFISSVNLGKTKVMVLQYTNNEAIGISFHLWTGDSEYVVDNYTYLGVIFTGAAEARFTRGYAALGGLKIVFSCSVS